ncbi:MAG: MG2 domain-containing protein, partial [Kofleriaceae bacterium]
MLAAACGSEPSSTRTDLSVTASPTGEITVTRGGQGQPTGPMRVVLTFSKPMVAPDQVGRPTASPPLVIAPNLAGRATWVDDRTLAFVPTARLPASTKFVATVPGTTRALDGNQLGKPHRFEFFADRLTGTVEALGSKLRAPRIPVVKLTFTQEVAFDQIDKHCGFSAGNHKLRVKLAPDSASGPGETFTIVPVAELTMDADWTVGCRAGLRGSIGDLGLAANLEDKLHTYGPLRFVTLDPSGNDIVPEESTKIALAFSNPLAPPYQIKISPAVAGFPQRCHALGDAPAGLSCGAQLEPRTAYTITIAAGQKDVFGQQLDKPQALAFRTADAQPTISMESGYFVAELARPVIPIWTRNVSELAVTAVRLTPANFHELAPLIDWWNAKPADLSKTKLTPRALKLPIAGTTNKWGQHSIGAAELFAATPGPGMFYVELGSKEVQRAPYVDDGRQKVLVNFTDIGVVSKLSGTRGLVWTTRLSTGKPLPGAAVTVRDRAGKLTWSGTTDADGVAILPGMAKLGGAGGDDESGHGGGESAEFRIFVAHQQDFTMVNPTRVGGLAPWNFNVDYDRDPAPTRLRGFMHTDRGLYRPGEKVHVKGIARVTKLGEPLAAPGQGKPVKVTVDGPQGKTVIETFAKLSAFGGFWFDLDLPGDARLGDYRIHAKLEHGTFTREFTVEEYRPATFEVTGKVKVAQVVRRGTIQATVSANYLYGAPLRAGDVNITVHSRPRWVSFPQHPEFAFRDERNEESYSDESDHSQTLVTEDKVALDDKGNAAVSVTVSPDDVYRDSDLLIRASVTAPSNEEISKTFTVPYYRSKRYFGIRSPGYV